MCSKCPDAINCKYSLSEESDLHEATLSCLKNNGDVAFLSLEKAQNFLTVILNYLQILQFISLKLKLKKNYKHFVVF